ncbi:MAG: PilZ domain-containing protein [Pseudolabrys sp.]
MDGSNKRRWFRVSPRGLVPRVGRILLGPKTTPIDCHIVDLSAGGACLELPRACDLPKRFEFMHGSTRRFCTLAWSRGFRIGISYEGTPQRSSVAGGLSRPKSGASLDSALFIPARRTWALPGAHRN